MYLPTYDIFVKKRPKEQTAFRFVNGDLELVKIQKIKRKYKVRAGGSLSPPSASVTWRKTWFTLFEALSAIQLHITRGVDPANAKTPYYMIIFINFRQLPTAIAETCFPD